MSFRQRSNPDPVLPGQESVWDYPRPPRLEHSLRRVLVELAGTIVADTVRAWRVLETSHPPTYYVHPDDVSWDLVEPAGRSAWRPAHFHFIVGAAGFRALTTEVFFAGDPYLDGDAIFGVRESLVVNVAANRDAALAKRYNLAAPFHSVTFDFRLGR